MSGTVTDDEITKIALAVGFIVHNGWGNLSDIKPVADAETLRRFARAIIDAEKEGRGAIMAGEAVRQPRF